MHAQEITIYNAIIVAFLIFGFVAGAFIRSMFKQHRRNIELYKAKVATEITTLEKERQRVATDLHDDLGPLLSAIKFRISNIDVTEEDAPLLLDAETYLNDAVQKLRQISNDLMPSTLIRKGLAYAIEEFIGKIHGMSDLRINFVYSKLPQLPDQININLYRILLEIIHNAVKHSQATTLEIILYANEKKIKLETKDNGKGFNVSTANTTSTSLGLQNLLNRTELLDGEMFVESAVDMGTAYIITIPYSKPVTNAGTTETN